MPSRARKTGRKRQSASTDLIRARPTTELWSVRSGLKPGYGRSLMSDNQVYKFAQTLDSGTILTTSAGADTFYSTAFLTTSLSQWNSFAAVFDQVRVKEIELWITPTYQDTSGGASNSRALFVIDYDDDTTPTTTAALLQYTNCIDTNPYNGVYRRWRPHTSTLVGPSAAGNRPSEWIDVGSAGGAKHYGFKMGAFATSVTSTYNMTWRLHVEFRNVF